MIPIQRFFPDASQVALGCMGFGGDWIPGDVSKQQVQEAHLAVDAALESGINFVDHADIYTMGKAEKVFGELFKQRPELKQQLIIQSKCGIRFEDELGPGRYDFSPEWIESSVEGSLKRLHVEQLDILLLHRPDPLMQPEEVAEVFLRLQQSGKVKHFGVSNMHSHQMTYLQRYLAQPLVVNQLQMSLENRHWLDETILAPGIASGAVSGAGERLSAGTVEYCRQENVQLQAWGCLAQGMFSGRDVSKESERIQTTAALVDKLASEYATSAEAIVLAWLMQYPAGIQAIIGTINPKRIAACGLAPKVSLSREHWYALYVSARGERLP